MIVGIVGASGFIGSAVCAALMPHVSRIVRIPAPRLRTSARNIRDLQKAANGASAELAALTQSISGCDIVVNAAGVARAGASGDELFGANALMPAIIGRAVRRVQTHRLLHISSAGVQAGLPRLDASRNYAPISPYTKSKELGERMLGGSGNTVIYRPTSVHGSDRQVTRQVWRIARSRLSSVAGAGDLPTPQTLVSSVASAATFIALAETPPDVVLHPYEGVTTAGILRDLGGREPVHIPVVAARAVLGVLTVAPKTPAVAANRKRLEMLWFGQEQDTANWLSAAGWEIPYSADDWRLLAAQLEEQARE